MAETRKYKVGDHVFSVSLTGKWKFMKYTQAVLERIEKGRAGEISAAIPVRAGDPVPARTFIQSKKDLPEDMDRYTLDFSNYEPFLYEGDEAPIFEIEMVDPIPTDMFIAGHTPIMKVEEELPWYHIYDESQESMYHFFNEPGKSAGLLRVKNDKKKGTFIPEQGMGPFNTVLQLTTGIMIMYTYATSGLKTLLMHASVIRHDGKANLFFGTSGTGKSTHSRLWLGAVEGCDLINDDNPVVRVTENGIFVYGTPWSGKTPCYRNIKVPVRTTVKLEQAPQNIITKTLGLRAYASIVTSSSCIKWKPEEKEAITRTSEAIAMGLPSWTLLCRPDDEAAITCFKNIEK
ncbi:MAG: phosphoenolpyruvate carboxykinase (ATP) [Bacteroidales bacterium]|nr:phosphoenolpyruvate carboxykinase (ATP) [Bacteroidales bacterium]